MATTWTTACPDWADRLRAGKSIIPAPIFPEEAERALAVFCQLRIVDAPGQPTFGEASEPWVLEYVAAIFGSYDAETGRRLIRETLMLIPKKNGKSTLAAGIMLTALILNWRQSAEMIILAPTVEVANNAFAPARDMVKADEELSALFHVQDHYRQITHRTMDATLKVVAADSDTVGGKKASWVLIDEEWLFGKRANAEAMFREAAGGLASRPEGVVIKLSTQSDEPPAGVFRMDLMRARQVRDGTHVDPQMLPVLYEHPPEMVQSGEARQLEHLAMVNPNFGVSVDAEFMRREFEIAELAGEQSLVGFLAKHGNVEVGLALRSDRWSGADFWDAQKRDGLSLEALLDRSEVVVMGIDGGGLDDLLGFNVLGRDSETGEWLSWEHAWADETVLERRKSEASNFRDFEKDGDLTIVDNLADGFDELAEIASMAEERGLLDHIGVDPAGLGSILDSLAAAGIPAEKVVGISQGWKLNGAIKTAGLRLKSGQLVHGGRRLMNWCVSNAKVEPKGNAIVITKQASGTAKIDPLMALLNSVSLMSLNPAGQGVSIYETGAV